MILISLLSTYPCQQAYYLLVKADFRTAAADAFRELKVLGQDGYALGVDARQVGVLEKTDEKGLSGLLQSEKRPRMETHVLLESLGKLASQKSKEITKEY